MLLTPIPALPCSRAPLLVYPSLGVDDEAAENTADNINAYGVYYCGRLSTTRLEPK